MSWWGKLFGGTVGFMLGGPLGALLGAALGHQLDGAGTDIRQTLRSVSCTPGSHHALQKKKRTSYLWSSENVPDC